MNDLEIHPEEPPNFGEPVWQRSWPSRIDCKDEVVTHILDTLRKPGWVSDDGEPWLQLCLDEVIVNAMLHGNEGDPNLMIQVAIYAENGRWILRIDDLGEGFSREHVPDPEDPDTLLLEHGRGIRIMREWLDRLVYYRNGATAVLERHFETGTPGASDGL
jgi:serine/threonine-protein kinase RsbW